MVLGATGGIGRALCHSIAAHPAFIGVHGFSRGSTPQLDLIAEASVAACASAMGRLHGDIRLVVIASGFLHDESARPERSWRELDPGHLAKAFAVNAIGPALVMKHFLPLLPQQGKSVFAVLSAKVGSIGDNRLGGWYSYRSSKAALNQLVRTAAIELRRQRPDAVCVALHPGTVATALSAPFAKAGLTVQTPDEAAARLGGVFEGLTASDTGISVRIATRNPAQARAVSSSANIRFQAVDVYDGVALADACKGCYALVNLVGILNDRGDDGSGFRRAHIDLTATALAACTGAALPCYVQVSALNASPDAPSHYLQTKGEAEALVVAARGLRTAILRPSVIFGAQDGLFGRFAPLVRWLPFLPLAGASARFQPVYVGDVAAAVLKILTDERLGSAAQFDLGGPEVCEHLPGKPFSRDNWRSMTCDSIVPARNGLDTLGIAPTPIARIMLALLEKTPAARRA